MIHILYLCIATYNATLSCTTQEFTSDFECNIAATKILTVAVDKNLYVRLAECVKK